MAQCENRALTDLRVAGLNPAGQLLIYFHNVFSSSYKNSMSTCKSSSQVPHQIFRAQTVALLTPAFGPPAWNKITCEAGVIIMLIRLIVWPVKCSYNSTVKELSTSRS